MKYLIAIIAVIVIVMSIGTAFTGEFSYSEMEAMARASMHASLQKGDSASAEHFAKILDSLTSSHLRDEQTQVLAPTRAKTYRPLGVVFPASRPEIDPVKAAQQTQAVSAGKTDTAVPTATVKLPTYKELMEKKGKLTADDLHQLVQAARREIDARANEITAMPAPAAPAPVVVKATPAPEQARTATSTSTVTSTSSTQAYPAVKAPWYKFWQ